MITVKSVYDIPYGKLTLNDGEIILDEKKYSTPANYIFSQAISPGIARQQISQSINPKTDYIKACDKLIFDTNCSAILEFIKIRSKNDIRFTEKLLETENAKLYSNSFSRNIYGKCLEQLRSELTSDIFCKNRKERNNPVYYMYIAEHALKELLFESNLQHLIDKKFERMSDLLRHLETVYGRGKIFKKAPDYDTILQIHKKRGVDYTTDPSALIKLVRRKNIRRVCQLNEFKIKEIAFACFVENIKHLYDTNDVEKDEIIMREKQSMSLNKYKEFISRIYNAFRENELPTNVTKQIEEKIKNIFICTEEEKTFFEQEVFSLHGGNDMIQRGNNSDELEKVSVIDVDKIKILNPSELQNSATVSSLFFPTVLHYAIFLNIKRETNHSLKDVVIHTNITSMNTSTIFKKFFIWIENYRKDKLEKYLNYVLKELLKKTYFQHLLLSTGKSTLNIHCDFPDIGQKWEKLRKHLQPQIFRINSLDEMKHVKIIQSWIYNQKCLIEFLKITFEKWLLMKNCNTIITINDIINNFFIDSAVFKTIEDYVDYVLSRMRIYRTDLQISDFIYKMQYTFSNKWIKRKTHSRLTNDETYNMFLLAILRILLVFDKLTSNVVTLCEDDVDIVMNILQCNNTGISYETFLDDFSGNEDNDVQYEIEDENNEMDGYDDEEEEDYQEEEEEDEKEFDNYFKGNDKIYSYISERCHNNVSENIENYIQTKVLNTKIDSKLKNRINFYAS